MLIFQDKLPLNPDGNPGQTPDLAFNTAISFLVNCNLQHYSGESGLTYFTQLFVITFLQFVSAATGIACLGCLIQWFKRKDNSKPGQLLELFCKIHYKNFIALSQLLLQSYLHSMVHLPALMEKIPLLLCRVTLYRYQEVLLPG